MLVVLGQPPANYPGRSPVARSDRTPGQHFNFSCGERRSSTSPFHLGFKLSWSRVRLSRFFGGCTPVGFAAGLAEIVPFPLTKWR